MWNWEALLIFQNSTLTTPQFHSAPCVLVNSGSFNLVNIVTFFCYLPDPSEKKKIVKGRGERIALVQREDGFLSEA